MEDFSIFLKVLMVIMGGGISAFTFYNLFSNFMDKKKKPTEGLAKTVKELEIENERNKEKLKDLENELKKYVDDRFVSNDKMVKKLNDDISDLKVKLEGNQKDIQLVLNSLLAIGNYFIAEGSKDNIKKANDSIVEHLINKN